MAELIDLRSDTVTKPTPGMRQAMANAEVGDDVFGEDPTLIRLQDRIAEMLGKEAALFVPSGTKAAARRYIVGSCAGRSKAIMVSSMCRIWKDWLSPKPITWRGLD
jgi:threonine aldolase